MQLRSGRLLLSFLIPLAHEFWQGPRSWTMTILAWIGAAVFYFWPELRARWPAWRARFAGLASRKAPRRQVPEASSGRDGYLQLITLAGLAESGEHLARLCIERRGSDGLEREARRWFAEVSAYVRDTLGPDYAARLRGIPPSISVRSTNGGAPDNLRVLFGIGACVISLHEFMTEIRSRTRPSPAPSGARCAVIDRAYSRSSQL